MKRLKVENDDDVLFISRRSPVYSTKHMVACSQPLAAAVGNSILSDYGGNAADAAVAVGACLAVLEPFSTGLGGDMFALFYDIKTKQVIGLNGSGRSAKTATLEYIQSTLPRGSKRIPATHGLSVTVPGVVAGWIDLVEKYGTLPLSTLLQPAINLARNGFPVSDVTAYWWKKESYKLQSHSSFLPPPNHAGEIMKNEDLARTLEYIVTHGRDGFYNSYISQGIVNEVTKVGGLLSTQDFASHTSTWETPLKLSFSATAYDSIQHDIWELPPNGQGIVALMALDTIKRLDFTSVTRHSAKEIHYVIESVRAAFRDAQEYIADPQFNLNFNPHHYLTNDTFIQKRIQSIHLNKVNMHSGPKSSSDTVSFQVADSFGNAISMVNSIYQGFGSGICPPGLGICLQNRGCNFSLNSKDINVIQGGKRPYHTIIPGIITLKDEFYASFSVMGGFMQPQGHVQVLRNLLEYGDTVQEALDRPRFCIKEDGSVGVEPGFCTTEVLKELNEEYGHRIQVVTGYNRALFGRGQVIMKNGPVLSGGSDGRGDGCVIPGV